MSSMISLVTVSRRVKSYASAPFAFTTSMNASTAKAKCWQETENCGRLTAFPVYFSSMREASSRICLAEARNSSPSRVTATPRAVRVKMAVRSSSSSARIDSVSVGCVTNTRRAASLIEPHAATASTYLSCCSVIACYPGNELSVSSIDKAILYHTNIAPATATQDFTFCNWSAF